MSELKICKHGIIEKCCAACAESEPPACISAGLDALFEQYVTADTEAREICEELQKNSRAFNDACARRDAAWETYRTAKNKSASNSEIRRVADNPAPQNL